MTTARDLMTPGAECIGVEETLVDAARKMRDLDVGALPICGEDQKLKGMLTDRDIVVRCLAEDGDPRTMAEHKVRRLPVIDGHKLVGIIAQADIARALPNAASGSVLHDVSV